MGPILFVNLKPRTAMHLLVTVLAVFLVLGVARRFLRRRYLVRGCGHSRHQGPGGPSRRGFVRRLSEKLGLSDEQRKVVEREATAFRKKLKAMRAVGPKTRTQVADVFRSDDFDADLLGSMFVGHDDALRELRLEFVERLAHIHEALNDSQRERLADLVERGMGFGGPFRGPAQAL